MIMCSVGVVTPPTKVEKWVLGVHQETCNWAFEHHMVWQKGDSSREWLYRSPEGAVGVSPPSLKVDRYPR